MNLLLAYTLDPRSWAQGGGVANPGPRIMRFDRLPALAIGQDALKHGLECNFSLTRNLIHVYGTMLFNEMLRACSAIFPAFFRGLSLMVSASQLAIEFCGVAAGGRKE